MELAVGDFTLPARRFGLKLPQNQYLKVKRVSTKKRLLKQSVSKI